MEFVITLCIGVFYFLIMAAIWEAINGWRD